MADNWTFSQARVEAATATAKQRVREHWARKQWFMWSNQSARQLNPNWVDPVIENEYLALENNPNTNPADMMTINAYMIFCWYRYKGYCLHAIAALLSAHVQESRMQGGYWEGRVHPFTGPAGSMADNGGPGYSGLTNFDATASPGGCTWYNADGTPVPVRQYSYNWSDDGGNTFYTKAFTYPAGTLEAAQGKKPNPASDYIVVGGQRILYYYWPGGVERYTYTQRNRGYGLVQWTDWPRLRDQTGYLTGTSLRPFHSSPSDALPGYDPQTATYYIFNYNDWDRVHEREGKDGYIAKGLGQYNWQLSLILHLMVLEFERQNAMARSPIYYPDLPNGRQFGYYYVGEWSDTAANDATYDPSPGSGAYTLRMNCTWDQFRDGDFLTMGRQIFIDQLTTDYRKIVFAMDVFRLCYLHTDYGNFGFDEIIPYWWQCVNYWDTVWKIDDIPRPREFPWLGFELDYYHQQKEDTMLLLAGRRKPHARRTILF